MSIADTGEATAGPALPPSTKTKQQKKDEGRRRALAIALSRQGTSPGTDAEAGNANAPRAGRKSARHGARNQHRHKHFARWILARFPHVVTDCRDVLDEKSDQGREGSMFNSSLDFRERRHVLDVAGGKGELAARLSLCHGLRVTMIDPRPADLSSVFLQDVVPKLPGKWQASVRERLQQSPTFVRDELTQRFSQLVEPFTTPSFQCEEHVEAAVRDAALLVGLHADGATEAIVDAALSYHKPFVVVPCCVFPNLFRERYVSVPIDKAADQKSGVEVERRKTALHEKRVPVRTHEQFCRYLLEKDPRFVMETLPFEGRNIAIWWDGISQ